MRKLVLIVPVLLAVSAALAGPIQSAVLSDGNGATITATRLDGTSPALDGRAVVDYSNLVTAGVSNYTVSSSDPLHYLGMDDYNGVLTPDGDVMLLTQFKFIGGVNVAGGVVFFDFFDAPGTTYLDGFGVQLPQAGNFLWTITITYTPLDPLFIYNNGQVGMAVGGAPYPLATAKWYLNSALPTIGTTAAIPPGLNDPITLLPMNFKFEITPEPASLLLVLAGLLIRRR